MNEDQRIDENQENYNSEYYFKYSLKDIFKIISKSLVAIFGMYIFLYILPSSINWIFSILFLIITLFIIIYNIKLINKYIKFKKHTKKVIEWADMNTKEKILYIAKPVLIFILEWTITLGVFITFNTYYGDEIIAKFNGENTYKEVVLETNIYNGVNLKDTFEHFFSDCKFKYFKTRDNLNVVEVRGKAYFMQQKVNIKLQFIVNSRNIGDFTLYTATINDLPQNKIMTEGVYKTICDSAMDINKGLDNNYESKQDYENEKQLIKDNENDKNENDKNENGNLKLADTFYGRWLNEKGDELIIDENEIYGSPYTVEKKDGNVYLIKVHKDGGYKLGINGCAEGILISNYDEINDTYSNGILYYNPQI